MARTKRGSGRDNGLRPTSGKEHRAVREQGVVKRLPGGLVARLRPPRLDDLVAAGEIPDVLSQLVIRMLYKGIDADDGAMLDRYEKEADTLSLEELRDWRQTLTAVCKAAFIEPKVVDEPQADDEIAVADIHPRAQWLVWQFAVGGAAFLKTFPDAPPPDVEPVFDEQTDAQPAQQDDTTEQPVDSVPV